MGRYVGNKWREDLPSNGPADQSQGNSVPVSSGSGGGGNNPTPPPQQTTAPSAGGGPVYQTVNGPRTRQQMEAELRGVGWNPATDALGVDNVFNVYGRTTGGAVTPTAAQAGGPPAGGPPNNPWAQPGNPLAQTMPLEYSLSAADKAALDLFNSRASGVTQAELAEKKRQFDATLEWTKQMWANQGLPQLVINQRAQALIEQKYQSDLELARQSMALSTAGVTGQFNGAPTLAAQQQQFGQGIAAAGQTGMYNGAPTLAAQQQVFGQHQALAQQAMDYLKTAASLQGPQNVFQQSNMFRGAQGNPDVPLFLQALQQNSRLPAFTAQGTPSTPLSMGTLTGGLTGQGANPGFNANSSLAAIKQLSDRGPASIAPGGLERLSPDELAALGSGLGAVGNSLPAFLQAYQQSRPQQSAMSGDMSLAA